MKGNINNILNGISIGIIITLVPVALFTNIFNYLHWYQLSAILRILAALTGLSMGVCVAVKLKYDHINTAILGISAMISAKSIVLVGNDLIIKGSGNVLNAILGIIIGVIIINLLDKYLKTYKLFVLPSLVIFITFLLTQYTDPYINWLMNYINSQIIYFTTLNPWLMSMLIAASFALLISSPLSSVAIALAVNLTGINAAAANIGIIALSVSYAYLSFHSNGLVMSLAHIFGSPKLQLANFLRKPYIIIPGLISAIISSLGVVLLKLQGDAMSAGFGLIGFIGPITHLNITGYNSNNFIITLIGFILIPIIVALMVSYSARKISNAFNSKNYKVEI